MAEVPDILAKICRTKQEEIVRLRRAGRAEVAAAAAAQAPSRGFRAALASATAVALIAEVKKASPSAGVIREDFDPVEIARAYERAGATCISVLTDSPFFQAEPGSLPRIRSAVGLPLLRKDFLLDELQVIESRALGADAFLLIAAALEPSDLAHLMAAGRDLGMDPLIEVHDERELDTALGVGADAVGINNRDLRTFEVSLETTERLAARVPRGVVVVAESGIQTPQDVRRMGACGVRAVLVGETIMRVDDVEAAARALCGH
jgi:indole-3-glycerol phosphate synthase